jgi:hypothetical protein
MDDAEKSMETKSIVELNKLDNYKKEGSYLRDSFTNSKKYSRDAPFKV